MVGLQASSCQALDCGAHGEHSSLQDVDLVNGGSVNNSSADEEVDGQHTATEDQSRGAGAVGREEESIVGDVASLLYEPLDGSPHEWAKVPVAPSHLMIFGGQGLFGGGAIKQGQREGDARGVQGRKCIDVAQKQRRLAPTAEQAKAHMAYDTSGWVVSCS